MKVEGMEQEEVAVEAVAVKGGAGNDLPQVSISKAPFPDTAFGLWVYPSDFLVRDRCCCERN